MAKSQEDPEQLFAASKRASCHIIDAEFDKKKLRWVPVSESTYEMGVYMTQLPTHQPGMIRIFDVTFDSENGITGLKYVKNNAIKPAGAILGDINSTYQSQVSSHNQKGFHQQRILLDANQTIEWSEDPASVNDVGSISAQWSQSFASEEYLYRLVTRNSLEERPPGRKPHLSNAYLTCLQASDDRLIVLIVNEAKAYGARRLPNPLGDQSWTSLSNGSVATFTKLLVLDFFLSSIYLQPVDFRRSLVVPGLPDERSMRYLVDNDSDVQTLPSFSIPRLSTKIETALEEIEKAEDIVQGVTSAVEPIQYVTEIIVTEDGPDSEEPWNYLRTKRIRELKDICKWRGSNAQKNLDRLSHELDRFVKTKQIQEADLVRILTILASIYLPLSLAASLLGMQYPFKLVAHDHVPDGDNRYLVGTNLLFDFFGISIGLGTATVFIFWAIRTTMWCGPEGLKFLLSSKLISKHSKFLLSKKWRLQERGRLSLGFVFSLTSLWIGAGFLLAVSAVFLVGMLGSAQNTWNAAKWTFTAYTTGGGSLILVFLATYRYFFYTDVKKGKITLD